jgi:RNA polymerase sigma factor (sigma-70 family)
MDNSRVNTTFSEIELIKGCLKGDRKVQKLLYDRYRKGMFSLAYRMVDDWELAHDVLQEAFIEVFKSIGQLRNDKVLGSWIRTIVVRIAIAKARERNKFSFGDFPEKGIAIRFNDPFTGEQLDRAIRSLPEGNKMVFLLVEVEGYKHREVAEILSISEGTSKSQLNYAKMLLKQKLAEFRYGNE